MHLVLLTNEYPFGHGEAFVTPELAQLVRSFDRVTIAPYLLRGSARPVPDGVVVDKSLGARDPRRPRRADARALSHIGRLVRELSMRPSISLHLEAALRMMSWFARAARTATWVAGRQQDAVEIFYSYWLNGASAGLAWARQRCRPDLLYVARAHNYDLYEHRYVPPFVPFRGDSIGGASAIFPISLDGRHHLAASYPDFADRLHLARLGVTRGPAVRRSHEGPRLRVLSIGRLEAVKRPLLLVDSIGVLARQVESVVWLHLGDGPERASVEELASSLPRHVEWSIAGWVPADQVRKEMVDFAPDAVVNTSSFEGIPVSLMEAAAHAVPLVAPDVGGVRELVSDETGVLLEPNPTPEEIANAVMHCAQHWIELGTGAQATVRRDFDASTNFAAFADELIAIANAR